MKRMITIAIGAFILSVLISALVVYVAVEPVALLGSFVQLSVTYNPGIAFGIALPPFIQELFIVVALVVVCIVALTDTDHTLSKDWGYGLVLGGAFANIADRFHDGVVTDYVAVRWFSVFNVADACITIGAIVLIWSLCVLSRHRTYDVAL